MRVFKLLRCLFPNEFCAGLFYVALSYIPFFLPPRDYGFWGSLVFGAIFYLGAIYLANVAIRKLSGISFIEAIFDNPRSKWNFIKLGLLGSIPFGLGVCDLGGLWYFPHWNTATYYLLGYALLGWVFYFLFLVMVYVAFKLAFDHLIPQRHKVTRYYKFERKSYRALGVIGGWMAVMFFTIAMQNTSWLTEFSFIINRPKPPFLHWYWWLFAMAGWIILCEYVEYRKKRSSLLKDTLHGYFTPLVAVVLCGITFGVVNEVQNLPINLWGYANYPLADVSYFGIPLFIIIGWPLHIIGSVEFYRAFGDERVTKMLYANAIQRKPTVPNKRASIKRPIVSR